MTIPLLWLVISLIVSFILPTATWPPSVPQSVAILLPQVVLIGFVVYGANFRDERTSLVSDKASRNGFYFVFYMVPLTVVVLSVTGASLETCNALVMMWIGAVAVFSISAFYHYNK